MNIHDFKEGQIFITKDDHKIEVIAVHKDKYLDEDMDSGSVEVRMYVHRDSKNCKSYGWSHNTKYFISFTRLDGGFGLLRKLDMEGYKLQ